MHVEFRLLGPLELRRGGEPVALRGAKLRALLVDLLLSRGEVVSVDRLIDDLWPRDVPAGARHALETHVSKLRSTLAGAATVSAEAPGYRLDVDAGSVDAVRFEQLLEEARDALAADPARAEARAAEALALWRGPALVDVAYEPFAQGESARLEELRLEAEEVRVDAGLALGRGAELVGELEALVAAAPLRERRRGQLMLALYRAGRQADALEVFREGRELLLAELGLDPSPALRELERAILQQDPSLAGTRPSPGAVPAARCLVSVVAVEPDVPLDLDAEEYERRTRRAADAVALVGREHGAGQPEPFVLVFAQEDHEARAAAAAAAVWDATRARVATASGEVLLGSGTLGGAVVALAKRLVQDAPADAPPAPPPVRERRHDVPFVGRERELALLRGLTAALVVGPAGIGKSRLAGEVARDSLAARGRCSSYGAAALAPLHEIAADLGAPGALEQTYAAEVPLAFRRLCEAVEEPLLVVVDDLQWADQLVLEAVEQLAAHTAPRLRLLCLAREELLEEQPGVLPGVERIALEALPPADAEELARRLAPEDGAIVDRALAAAEGNPLFLEQLLAHGGDGELPATLRSLLAARLDRLAPSERAAVEQAAVIGREFDAALLGELGGGSPRGALAGLVRRGFVEPAAAEASFEERFRFRHALLHEAAYEAAPKEERSRLHERLADLLADRDAEDEAVGFHLERACELRPARDRHARRLAHDAGRRLAAAGMAAWRLGYAGRTSALLGRAAGLLEPEDEQRRELLCELGIALGTAGETAAADETLAEAAELAARVGDRRVELRARLELAAAHLLDDSGGGAERVLTLAHEALPVFEGLGDHHSLGRAWMLTGWVQGGVYLHNELWSECAAQALGHYRAAGLPSSTCIGHLAAAAYFGPLPASAGVARCLDLLEREVDDLAGEATVLAHLGGLEAMLGRFEDAWERLAAARAIYRDLGRPTAIVRTCAPIEADAARWAGDLERERATLIDSCATLRELQNWTPFGTQAAALADACLRLGREPEARAWLDDAELRSRSEDLASQLKLRRVRAQLLRCEGDDRAAVRLARETADLAARTDALNERAELLLVLASVLGAAGEDGRPAAAQALEIFEAKENAAAAAHVGAAAAAADGSR